MEHLERMEDHRIPKKAFQYAPRGRRNLLAYEDYMRCGSGQCEVSLQLSNNEKCSRKSHARRRAIEGTEGELFIIRKSRLSLSVCGRRSRIETDNLLSSTGVNCPKTGLNLTIVSNKPSLMRQLDQEIMGKNDAETDQKEKKKLVGSLAEKKLLTEGCTGMVNGRRVGAEEDIR
ncbi:hypothetical protein ANN_08229 [Periplaneta americana]|uniref:Uncharacterized protein n=1 Tax=Periplaneta americana TaxID=6978 RepID=A0ABQ8T0V4_PERAM|nr:hypothetical protein ANN_08229 [Periplaneta americana]